MKEAASETATLHAIQTEQELQVGRRSRQTINLSSWGGRVSILEKSSSAKRAVYTAQAFPKSRAARIEQLQAQVEAGTYKVDSRALARKMLANETHFLEGDQ